MFLRTSLLAACGLLCSACVGTNPFYVDPTTATATATATVTTTTTGTTTLGETGDGSETDETGAEASTEPDTTSPTSTGMTTSAEPWCGDGSVDAGEECDDGPDNGDGECNSKCEFAVCGDGEAAPWEECDDGKANGTARSGCTFFCEEAECGDSVLALGEECDDGENNVDGDGFTCHSDCTQNYCGDTFISPDEECDPIENLLDHCDLESCTLQKCGDGVVTGAFEQCDVMNDDPKCLPNCMYPPAPLGSVGVEVDGGVVGNDITDEVKLYCNMASFVGFYGKIDLTELWLGQAGVICGERTLEQLGQYGYTVMHGKFSDSQPVGAVPDDYDEGMTQCSDDEVLVGVKGTGEEYLTSLSAICMKVKVVAVAGKWLPIPHLPTVAPPLGDDGGMAGSEAICPPGHAVSRVSVYAGDAGVSGVEIYCKLLSLP